MFELSSLEKHIYEKNFILWNKWIITLHKEFKTLIGYKILIKEDLWFLFHYFQLPYLTPTYAYFLMYLLKLDIELRNKIKNI